jgi:hypothetical protein
VEGCQERSGLKRGRVQLVQNIIGSLIIVRGDWNKCVLDFGSTSVFPDEQHMEELAKLEQLIREDLCQTIQDFALKL